MTHRAGSPTSPTSRGDMVLVFISARYSLGLTGHVQYAPTYLFTVNKLVTATPTSK